GLYVVPHEWGNYIATQPQWGEDTSRSKIGTKKKDAESNFSPLSSKPYISTNNYGTPPTDV
ncbi:MAG: hypothetical protein ACE5KJ_02955, partial [Candidatus Zixiibacteriota bacterium]